MERSASEWMILPLRRYAQFRGRSSRAEYWWFELFVVMVALAAFIVDTALGLRSGLTGAGLVGRLTSLALVIPHLAVAVRRLHDLGRTGWWLGFGGFFGALLAIALVVFALSGSAGSGAIVVLVASFSLVAYAIVALVWFCSRGTVGPNRFGPDPLTLGERGVVLG